MPLRAAIAEPPCSPLPQNPVARSQRIHRVPGKEDRPAAIAVRAAASEIRKVSAGVEVVSEFDDCEAVFCVLSGWMVLKRILEDGRQQVLDFALPGRFIGDPTARCSSFGYSVAALTDAEYAVLPKRRIPELLRASPSLISAVLDAAYDALNSAYDSLTDIGRRTALEAVASYLYRTERRIRRAVGARPDGSVDFPFTQSMIADALGLTPEHVCRMLRKLKADGVLQLNRTGLHVRDRDRLADLAGVMPEFEDDDTVEEFDIAV
jgi:CRP/FNR family transcriptional regulator